MLQPKGIIFADSEYEQPDDSLWDWMRESRGMLVQDEIRVGSRGCMMQGPEGHGKSYSHYLKSDMHHKRVLNIGGTWSEMYFDRSPSNVVWRMD